MFKDLFDINTLPPPLSDKRYTGRRLVETKIVYDISPCTYYDHFVTNGYEIIILNIQTMESGAKEFLESHGFRVVCETSVDANNFAFRKTSLPNTFKDKHGLVLCLYFFNHSNENLERFLDYYTSQGVEKFFIYFCGKLSDRSDLPKHERVEYFEWDYIHGIYDARITNGGFQHYSQIPLYNMFCKKISPFCDWTIFCDLDEYIKVCPYHVDLDSNAVYTRFVTDNLKQPTVCPTAYPIASIGEGETIKSFLYKSQLDCSIYIDQYTCDIDFESRIIRHESSVSDRLRGKTIVKGSKIKLHDMVRIHRILLPYLVTNLRLYHFRRFKSDKSYTCIDTL